LSTPDKPSNEEFDLLRVMEDLTLLLIHLSSWKENASADLGAVMSWKGYDFRVLDRLTEKGYISGSRGAKSVILTDEGVREAERLENLFLRAMGGTYKQDEKVSMVRSKARDEVEFFCEICQSAVRAPSGYEPFERYCEGKMPQERVMELLRRYHVKHWHTNALKTYRDRFAYNVRKGMEFMDAANEARGYARKMVPEQEDQPSAGKDVAGEG
jgi:hypothetical protein